MQPLGQTIYLWRNAGGLTQAEVARRSGVSRPNLSAIEQGARDLTLETLRRIAAVLGTTAGTLADGVGPTASSGHAEFDRFAMDRIGRLAVGQKLKAPASERRLAKELAALMSLKTESTPRKRLRVGDAAVLRLKSRIGPRVFEHLIRRVEKNLAGRLIRRPSSNSINNDE